MIVMLSKHYIYLNKLSFNNKKLNLTAITCGMRGYLDCLEFYYTDE